MIAASTLLLTPETVHVWRIALSQKDEVVAQLGLTLADDELERAARFRTPILQRRFVIGRAGMRSVLARYLGVEPGQISFAYGPRGKPKIAGVGVGVEFNLSHTGDVALCAITRERAVGVDIEQLRPIDDAAQIIARFFSPREQAEFLEYPLPDRPETFFRAWTRKEALLKATGDGLASLTESLDVPLADVGAARMRIGFHSETGRGWTLQDLDVGPGYLAALAVEGELAEVNLFDWESEMIQKM